MMDEVIRKHFQGFKVMGEQICATKFSGKKAIIPRADKSQYKLVNIIKDTTTSVAKLNDGREK